MRIQRRTTWAVLCTAMAVAACCSLAGCAPETSGMPESDSSAAVTTESTASAHAAAVKELETAIDNAEKTLDGKSGDNQALKDLKAKIKNAKALAKSDTATIDEIEKMTRELGKLTKTVATPAEDTEDDEDDEAAEGTDTESAGEADSEDGAAIATDTAEPAAQAQQPQEQQSGGQAAESTDADTNAENTAREEQTQKQQDGGKAAEPTSGSGSGRSDDQQQDSTATQTPSGQQAGSTERDNSSSTSKQDPAPTPEKQKIWVDEQGHWEQIQVQAAWDEQVDDPEVILGCSVCGARDVSRAHLRSCGGCVATIGIEHHMSNIHHDAVYERQWVVDVPGHWE